MKQVYSRLLREPLLHFFVVGAILFAVFYGGNEGAGPESSVIEISQARLDQLSAQFASTWNRTPSPEELENIVQLFIREEIYYRDALVLGLDKDDAVIKQRLRQKMEFLTETSASFLEPTDEELQAWYEENRVLYESRPRLALEQIFLGQIPTEAEVDRALDRLRSNPSVNPADIGEQSLLPPALRLTFAEGIDAVYGAGFFSQVRDFPEAEWSGPVVSSYGTHLVRILEIEEASSPSLDDVRDVVERDWRADTADEIRERDYLDRLANYTIERTAPSLTASDNGEDAQR
jgi:hypothetical protein